MPPRSNKSSPGKRKSLFSEPQTEKKNKFKAANDDEIGCWYWANEANNPPTTKVYFDLKTNAEALRVKDKFNEDMRDTDPANSMVYAAEVRAGATCMSYTVFNSKMAHDAIELVNTLVSDKKCTSPTKGEPPATPTIKVEKTTDAVVVTGRVKPLYKWLLGTNRYGLGGELSEDATSIAIRAVDEERDTDFIANSVDDIATMKGWTVSHACVPLCSYKNTQLTAVHAWTDDETYSMTDVTDTRERKEEEWLERMVAQHELDDRTDKWGRLVLSEVGAGVRQSWTCPAYMSDACEIWVGHPTRCCASCDALIDL